MQSLQANGINVSLQLNVIESTKREPIVFNTDLKEGTWL